MKQLISSTSMGLCALSLAACQSVALTHFNRTTETIEGRQSVTFVDAKQRAVVSSYTNDEIAICAEPSPDALSALAASQGVSISRGDIQAALSSALSESAGNIGLRTQSIQLMRDMMYRLCEASISDSLEPLAFETTYRRFQSSMVAILAIEQLTGTVAGPTVGLGGGATASALGATGVLDEMVEEQERQVEAAKAKVQEIETKLTAARAKQAAREQALQTQVGEGMPIPQDDAELVSIKSEITELEAAKTSAEATQKHEERMLEQLREAEVLSASSRATANSFGRASPAVISGRYLGGADEQAKIAVARSVRGIVEQAINLPFTGELCTTILVADHERRSNGISASQSENKAETISLDDELRTLEESIQSNEEFLSEVRSRMAIEDIELESLYNEREQLESRIGRGEQVDTLRDELRVNAKATSDKEKLTARLSAESSSLRSAIRRQELRLRFLYEQAGAPRGFETIQRCHNLIDAEIERRNALLREYEALSDTRVDLVAEFIRTPDLLKDADATANAVAFLETIEVALREISEDTPEQSGSQSNHTPLPGDTSRGTGEDEPGPNDPTGQSAGSDGLAGPPST